MLTCKVEEPTLRFGRYEVLWKHNKRLMKAGDDQGSITSGTVLSNGSFLIQNVSGTGLIFKVNFLSNTYFARCHWLILVSMNVV